MFDLNDAVLQWRDTLAQGEAYSKSDRDELETHLHEQIEDLKRLGLSDEEAFFVTTHRLGDTKSLTREYSKINGSLLWKHRVFWMATGLLGYFLLFNLSKALGELSAVAAIHCGLKGIMLGFADCLGRSLVLGGVLYSIYLGIRNGWLQNGRSLIFHDNRKGRVLFYCLLSSGLLMILMIPYLTLPLMTRFLGPMDYGHMVMIRNGAEFLMSFLFPLILVYLIFRCRDRRRDPVAEY